MTLKPISELTLLFEAQRDTLDRYFRKRTAHAWDAQDLVQELYLRLLRTDRQNTEVIRNPEAYLFTIAANLIREHATMRQRAPLGGEELEDVLERLATPCEAAANADRAVRRRRLGELIQRLPPKCRAVLVMHYRDDMGYREIGEQLSISPNMVKKYIVKALAACRTGMARYD
ncbi:RNA polymerase sigma factor [Dyella sp. 20L07]|uniref:RNA polymerase sigma factor n=1 Tax=Dyella sp. 20L07 TaxID=3384240 RepID=UPI003D2BD441